MAQALWPENPIFALKNVLFNNNLADRYNNSLSACPGFEPGIPTSWAMRSGGNVDQVSLQTGIHCGHEKGKKVAKFMKSQSFDNQTISDNVIANL